MIWDCCGVMSRRLSVAGLGRRSLGWLGRELSFVFVEGWWLSPRFRWCQLATWSSLGFFFLLLRNFFETFSSFLLLRVFGVLFDMSALKRCYIGLPSAIATMFLRILEIRHWFIVSTRFPQGILNNAQLRFSFYWSVISFNLPYSTKIGLIRLLFQIYINRCSAHHHRII